MLVMLPQSASFAVRSAEEWRRAVFTRRVAKASLGFACVALAPLQVWAQGDLRGFVRGAVSAAPIESASLVLDGIANTQSQSDGHYGFEHVARGTHVVTVRAVGYRERVDTILVDSSAVQTLHDFQLDRIVVLDSVLTTAAARKYISPGLQGFEERRATGFGRFITDSILRREENEPLVNILKTHVTGLRTIRVHGEDYAVTTHSQVDPSRPGSTATFKAFDGLIYPDECYVSVYVDGTLRYDKGLSSRREPPPALGGFFVTDLGAIEYYAGSAAMPPQFQSKSGCGALVIWTRER